MSATPSRPIRGQMALTITLADLMRRCNRELEERRDQSFLYFATWMKGATIPSIISDLEKFKNDRADDYELPKLIRQVLGEIEKDLRFRYVRLTSCYNAVLKFALTEAGQAEFKEALRRFRRTLL